METLRNEILKLLDEKEKGNIDYEEFADKIHKLVS